MLLLKKLKAAGIWQTIEVVVIVIAQLLYMSIMARILSKPDFGLMAIANSFVVMGHIFAESGMGLALIQKQNITNKHINAALQGGILFGLILFVLLFSISPLISKFYEHAELKVLIRVIAINFFILSVSSVSLGILQKRFRFKEKSLVSTCSIIISYSIGIFLGFNGYGVWSLVVATLLLSTLKMIGYFYFSKIKLIKGIYLNEWKDLFSFGFGIVLLKINNYISSNGINLVLGKIFPPASLGVFERVFQIKTLPSLYFGNILDAIMFPTMSEIQNEQEKLFKIYQHSLGVVNTLLLPIALYLIFFSEEIVLILLGKNWQEAVVPLQIMFVILPFTSSGRMADSVIRAKGLVYENAFRKFLYVIVLLLSAGYGAYYYGLKGAAWGVSISSIFNYFTMLSLVKKVFQKSIVEIFFSPLLAGVKLTMILLLILITTTSLFNIWGTCNILFFLILTILLSMSILILIYKKPSFFGKHLYYIMNKLKNNK